MRLVFAVAFSLMAANVQAGVFERCVRKEKDQAAISSCVDAEHVRAGNFMRQLNKSVLEAVMQHAQKTGDKSKLLRFEVFQANYVRHRSATCQNLPTVDDVKGCEADAMYAHLEELNLFLR